MALRGAGKWLDPFHVVVLAVEVRCVQLAAVRPHPTFAVTDDGVVVPAVPHPHHDLDEFVCARVTVGVIGMDGLTEIGRGQWRDGGDDVPAGAPAAEVIQCCESTGELPRFVVGRRAGANQPDVVGDGGQR